MKRLKYLIWLQTKKPRKHDNGWHTGRRGCILICPKGNQSKFEMVREFTYLGGQEIQARIVKYIENLKL